MTPAARILPLLAALLLLPAAVGAEDGWAPALSEPAARLWSPLPPDARIAVRPLDPDASGLPAALLGVAERSLVAALVASAPTGGVVLTRSELPAVWEERESFTGTDAKGQLAEAAVDAVVVPALAERRGGVSLSAVLIGLRGPQLGAVLAVLPATALPADLERSDLARAESGARRLGVALAEGLRLAADPAEAIVVQVDQRGIRSPAADWLAGMVGEHLIRRLAEPPPYLSRPLRDLGKPAPSGVVRLSLDLWDQGARLDVQARAVLERTGRQRVETQGTARIALASIPDGFLPLTRSGGRVGEGLYRASGAYRPAGRTDPREIRFAARILARAALVADGQGGGGHRVGRDPRDIAEAMRSLARVLPHEEIWGAASAGDGTATLAARLARLGGADAPRLEAAVARMLYRPGEPLSARILLRGGRAYVAAYAWQADDTVVRIAPTDAAARAMEPDRRVDLPGPGDAQVTVAPLAGSDESVEAILVVASAVPFSAETLAPAVAGSADASLAGAAQMSAFLDALAGLDLARVSLAVLPYRIRAAD